MAKLEGETQRQCRGPLSTGGPLKSLAFLLYAAVAWVPCLIGGVIIGTAIGIPPAEEGVIQGRTLSMTAAMPEILAITLLFLALAYAAPALYLNRKGH